MGWEAGVELCHGNADHIWNDLSVLMVLGELRTGDLFMSPLRTPPHPLHPPPAA